jgi:hypothetical protein
MTDTDVVVDGILAAVRAVPGVGEAAAVVRRSVRATPRRSTEAREHT